MTRHGLRVPASMTSLSRALLTLDGTLRVIDPSFELATEASAAAEALAAPEGELDGDLRPAGAAPRPACPAHPARARRRDRHPAAGRAG